MFVTVFAGISNLATGIISYANAGHDAPFVILAAFVTPTNSAAKAGRRSARSTTFHTVDRTWSLTRGDLLLLYTDGVTEAEDRDRFLL